MTSATRAPSTLRALVVGLGNAQRRDDGVGLVVARSLQAGGDRAPDVVEVSDDLLALLDLWAERPLAIVVDAIRSGRPPGTVVRLEGSATEAIPAVLATSTHGLSLADGVGLGRALGRLPRRLVVYGIEAGDLAVGWGLSAPVERAVLEAVAQIRDELLRSATGSPDRGTPTHA